jgi:hypothetical protein
MKSAALVFLLPLGLIHAAVYDGFQYPAGASLAGQNGGSGWGAAWDNGATQLDVKISSGLSFGNLATSPGAALSDPTTPNQVAFFSRQLGTTYGADNTTVYVSFLLRPEAGFGFYGGINFGNIFVGKSGPTTTYGIEGPVNDISSSTTVATAGTTVLLVLRADFLPGNDRFSLYVDPTPGGSEPAVADAVKTDFDSPAVNSLFLNNAGNYTTDEIRIGDTFASVTSTAAPEPAGLGAATAFIAALILRRRMR